MINLNNLCLFILIVCSIITLVYVFFDSSDTNKLSSYDLCRLIISMISIIISVYVFINAFNFDSSDKINCENCIKKCDINEL